MAFLQKRGASFLNKTIDDQASRLTTVKEVVDFLQDARTIVTLEQIQAKFPASRIPIDELCDDERVEASMERNRFKFIPKITKLYGEFVNNRADLLGFLTRNPNGIKLIDLIDAYDKIDRDIYALSQAGSAILINPKEWKEANKVMSADTRAKKEREEAEREKWAILPDDPRVMYPADYWLKDDSLVIGGVATTIQPLDKQYNTLWKQTNIPQTMAQIRKFLTENGHEVLPEKAAQSR